MSQSYIGEIRMFGGNFAPVGWALCDGRILSISEYDALFNLIGTTYGGDLGANRCTVKAQTVPRVPSSSSSWEERPQLWQPRAGNEPGTGSVARMVVVVLCVRVTCTLAENDVAGAPLQGSGESRVENRPGYRTARTRIQPL